MRALITINGVLDRFIVAETPDEMFLEIAAVSHELTLQGQTGVCTVSDFDVNGPEAEKYRTLFNMGRP